MRRKAVTFLLVQLLALSMCLSFAFATDIFQNANNMLSGWKGSILGSLFFGFKQLDRWNGQQHVQLTAEGCEILKINNHLKCVGSLRASYFDERRERLG